MKHFDNPGYERGKRGMEFIDKYLSEHEGEHIMVADVSDALFKAHPDLSDVDWEDAILWRLYPEAAGNPFKYRK